MNQVAKRPLLETRCKLKSKLSTNYNDELKRLFHSTSKIFEDYSKLRSRHHDLGSDYKKCLKEIQRLQKDMQDKNSKIQQQEIELTHNQGVISEQKEKIMRLTKDDTELSAYRNSSMSIASTDINNELFNNQSKQEYWAFKDAPPSPIRIRGEGNGD